MNVILPVAGEGKRLRPYTHTKPKQLLLVAGRPAIDHIMQSFLPLNPARIYFVTGHLRHHIERYMRKEYPGVPLRFIEQTGPYGTATAVHCAREAFDEDVIIDFGDTIFDTDLSIIKDCEDDGIIWAMHREDYQRFGVILTDGNGHMTRIVEKPSEPISKLANIGLYYVKNTRLLLEALEWALAHHKEGDEIWLTNAFQYMIDHGAKLRVEQCSQWFDCGTPEALLDANKVLLGRGHATRAHHGATIIPPVFIHASAVVESSTIGPHVSIGAHAHIVNSSLANTIIDEGATVENAELKDSILGVEAAVKGNVGRAIIGDHSRVELPPR